jgi:hypothetical protein
MLVGVYNGGYEPIRKVRGSEYVATCMQHGQDSEILRKNTWMLGTHVRYLKLVLISWLGL